MKGKAVLIVIDSVGIGEMPDAAEYGDEGSDTLGHIYHNIESFQLPNMEGLGLRAIEGTNIYSIGTHVYGAYGRMPEASKGKDSTTGHWEMAGLTTETPFATFPHGFDPEIIEEFESLTGFRALCNKPYSGTEVIKDYGEEHLSTGQPIVYTSADSVFQIAAHEDVIPLEKLYEICEIARGMLDKYRVSRVIARPFIGPDPLHFTRTPNRRDFSMPPFGATLLDRLREEGIDVLSIGKISDLFAGRGIAEAIHTNNNAEGIQETLKAAHDRSNRFVFTNLVDFDQLYGHRNNVAGYGEALKEFDSAIPQIIDALSEDDILMITADHGNDPSTPSTDHSREYVPLLAYKKGMKPSSLGTRESFSDVAATLSEFYGLVPRMPGKSFLSHLE